MNHKMNTMAEQPVAEALTSAVAKQWSGILRAMVADEQRGMIVLCNGRIAWAVSKNQTKDFPYFLEQIGRVPPDRLREIVRQQSAPDKSKKLGLILEEAGLITHATFRECLLEHVRSAFVSLLKDPLMHVQPSKAEVMADNSLTFSLPETLGSTEVETDVDDQPVTISVPEGGARSCNGELLENLALLSGYMYSFVANTSGKLLAFHEAEHAGEQVETLFATVADWLSTSLKAARTLGMGAARVTFMEGVDQSLLVQATDSERRHFLAVAFNEEGRLGVVKTRIASMIPSVQTFTEKR
jgi:predicted regulator of Ras-like GTPase activity (Roadblock/LC7/MglB family)